MSRFSRSEHCWEAALEGEITPAMAAHLDECDECARKVEGVERAARAVSEDMPLPPAGMDERVLAALERARAADVRVERGVRLPARRAALAGLAALVVVAALALVLRPAIVGDAAQAIPIEPLSATCPPEESDGSLLVAGVWAGEEARRFAEVLARFERRTGFQVRYAYETREIAAKLEARNKHGCAPDVALLPQPGLVADLVRRGRIGPIDDVVGALVARNYTRPWRELGTVDGRLYGVWFKAANKSTVWYDREALAAAGVRRPPETWTELIRAARRVQATGVRPFAIAGSDGWSLTDWFENVYLRSAGPAGYDALAEHRIRWTSPSVKIALRRLAEVFADEGLIGPAADAAGTTFEDSVAQVFGGRPRVRAAMVFEGDFVRSFIPRAAASRAGFFPFPSIGASPRSEAVVGGDLAVLFTDGDAGRELIRYLATPEAAEPWVRTGGFLSPNRRVDARLYPDALARAAAAALTQARSVRFDLSDLQPPAFGARAEQGMWEIFQYFLAHPRDVDTVTRRLETAAAAARACERAIGGMC